MVYILACALFLMISDKLSVNAANSFDICALYSRKILLLLALILLLLICHNLTCHNVRSHTRFLSKC